MRFPSLLSVTIVLTLAVPPAVLARNIADFSTPIDRQITSKQPIQRALLRQKRLEWRLRGSGTLLRSSSSSSLPTGSFRYDMFKDGVLGNGQEALLYFYTPRSRICQGYDKILKKWSNARLFTVPLYRVEYEERTDLKTRFGVRNSNSFVHVNGKGELIKYHKTMFEAAVRNIVYK